MEYVEKRELRGAKAILSNERRESALLLRKLREGDNTAYEQVNRQYKARLYQRAWRILRNDAAAEDAVQDALVLTFSRIRSFDGKSSLYTWMTAIFINCCLGELRKIRRRPIIYLEDAFDGENSWTEQIESTQSRADVTMISKERIAVLNEAIGSLQPDQIFILRARSELDLSLTEIAKQLGISLAAAKSRALRARRICVQNARNLIGEGIIVDRGGSVLDRRPVYQQSATKTAAQIHSVGIDG